MKIGGKFGASAIILCLGTAAVPVGAQTPPAPAAAPTATPPGERQPIVQSRLDLWMERHFEAVAGACNLRKRAQDSYIPPAVRAWDGLEGRAQTNVWIAPTDSLEALFSRVYQTGSGTPTLLSQPLGLSSGVGEPMRYPLRSRSSIAHNCVTLLAATTEGGFNLSFGGRGGLEAGLRYATSNPSNLSAHFYSGEMISPLAVSLGDTRVPVRPRGMARLDGLLAMWSWYAAMNNPAVTTAGEGNQLYTIRDITGLAAYRVRGQTQSRLLRGSVGGGFNLLFIRVGGEATGNLEETVSQDDLSYSVAFWGQNTLTLMRPSALARELGDLLVATLVASSPQPIENDSPFEVSWDTAAIPQAMCEQRWESGTRQVRNAPAAVSAPRTAWIADGARCRFSVQVTPPTAPGTQFVVAPAMKSSIPATGTPASYDLVLQPPELVIPDYRGSVGFYDPSVAPEFVLGGSGAATTIKLTYPIREQDGRTVNQISLIPPPNVTCDQQVAAILSSRASPISRTAGSVATIEIEYQIPNSVIGTLEAGGRRSCHVNGKVDFSYSVGQRRETLRDKELPRYNFVITRPTAGPNAPATTPSQAPRPRT